MPSESDGTDGEVLSPDDAFAALANETRMAILQALGHADGPMAFSTLRDHVGVRDSGQFNYHLGKLTGHFIRQTDEGYTLRQAGRRVIEAVLSGAVTGGPDMEATPIEVPCIYCDAGTEVSFRQERLLWRCTECPGTFADREATSDAFGTLPSGTIELAYLPAAGIQHRTPREMLEASDVWSAAEDVALTNGVCPRCSGTIEDTVDVCEDHDDTGGVCPRCHTRLGVTVRSECTNCNHTRVSTVVVHLLADPTFRSVFDSRGVDVIATPLDQMSAFVVRGYDVLKTDPFRARMTFLVAGDEITFTVDADLSVADVMD